MDTSKGGDDLRYTCKESDNGEVYSTPTAASISKAPQLSIFFGWGRGTVVWRKGE